MADEEMIHRCSGQYDGCTAELRTPRGGTDRAATYAARTAGWRMFTPRLHYQPMKPVFTCPDCVAAER